MVFSSTVFLYLFLPIVLLLYFAAPHRHRNLLLLMASLVFYAWGEGFYVTLMLVSIALNYVAGRAIHRFRPHAGGKIALISALAANLGLLAVFKYANFVVDTLNSLLAPLSIGAIALNPIHLPIGISFFTFQAMSYVVDVYRRESTPQSGFVNTALYISLFPQLIAGPIVRYHDIAAQLAKRRVTLKLFSDGVIRFTIGLGKKMLIANPLGEVADQIFAIPPSDLTASLTWLGVICYGLQIYFDFSGYSDMAIGLGRMFGFRFLINFNYPYISRSIREFWRRWHISLSRWFRDYLYVPLGGNRFGSWTTHRNLLLVFFLCGLWHGASWNFVIWGLIHGGFLVLERTDAFGGWLRRTWSPLRHAYSLFVVTVAWVFFRADDLPYALQYIGAMFGVGTGESVDHHLGLYLNTKIVLVLGIGVLGATPILPLTIKKARHAIRRSAMAANILSAATVTTLALIMLAAAMHLAAGTHNPFIYFRF
ncbi:MAG: MBOAT family protein [Gammaproteobacteria bacterium]|nr:MBOAT family protein [Gammaproteobacteria bacterium]MDH3380000.1 MBOAT family protein [Gammaproteobacteria bacterium]